MIWQQALDLVGLIAEALSSIEPSMMTSMKQKRIFLRLLLKQTQKNALMKVMDPTEQI